ncbi:MAG: carbon-nitrogen hydrolase family protein [Bacteroidales bacterium]
MSKKLKIATCQFPVSANVESNCAFIIKQMKLAKSIKADIVHFSESCLSGYAGIDFPNIESKDYDEIQNALEKIRATARQLKIWALIGSHHFEENQVKPFISLHLFNPDGKITDRYDKRILAGSEGELDNKFYSAGEKAVVFKIKGSTCGLSICHEWRYTELYREYKKLKVDLIFQSFYDGNFSPEYYREDGKELARLIIGTMRGNAANNYLWISVANTSRKESGFPSFILQPDGKILHKLVRNRTGVLITDIDIDQKFIDPSFYGRKKFLIKD